MNISNNSLEQSSFICTNGVFLSYLFSIIYFSFHQWSIKSGPFLLVLVGNVHILKNLIYFSYCHFIIYMYLAIVTLPYLQCFYHENFCFSFSHAIIKEFWIYGFSVNFPSLSFHLWCILGYFLFINIYMLL